VTEWILRHRAVLMPMALVADGAVLAALLYFGWHYVNCAN